MPRELIQTVVTTAVGIVLALVIARQCRKPAWLPGRLFLWIMNRSHAAVTRWGLSHVPIEKQFTILDVGCGGGKTIDTLAGIASDGKVCGIDYSKQSVATARRLNAQRIAAGRVDIQQGSVSSLPFPADTFDIVSAVETHYYWPDLPANLREILRVLRPGGHLALIAETYKGRSLDWLYRPVMGLLGATYLTVAEHREVLQAAGFAEIEIFEERARGWICAVSSKPS